MSQLRPTYQEWVLAYVTQREAEGNWVEGRIVDMSRHLRERGWWDAGQDLSSDMDIDANTANRIGLAYFRMSMTEDDDLPVLSDPVYVWTPPK